MEFARRFVGFLFPLTGFGVRREDVAASSQGWINDRHYCSQATPKMGVRQIPHYDRTCPRSRHLNPPGLSISPSDLPIPSPHAPHVHTPRCAALSAPAGGVCCSHPHIQSPHRALPPSAGRLASRRVPPARGSIGCPSQYFSKSLVTCAMVLPLVSGSLLKVNHPKKKVRPTKIR